MSKNTNNRKPLGIFDPPKGKIEKQITNEIEAVLAGILAIFMLLVIGSIPIIIIGMIF